MTAKTYHVNSLLGVLGDVTFGCDSNHFLETHLYSSDLSLYEITKNGIEKRLSLLFLDDGEAIFSEPSSGRYWSTREGGKYITFQRDNQISRIDQFKANLYDPNFIQAILQCQKPTVAATPPPVPPQVEILSPQISPLSSQKIKQTFLSFKLRLSGKQIIETIAVIVNGTKRQTWTINSKDKKIEVLVDSLQSGYNQISFIATDVQENTSFPFGYTVYVTAENKNLPDLYFLGIGANSTNLKYPYEDAKLLASQFAKMKKGKYWNKIQTQVPEKITRKGIKKALRRLSSKLTANDLLIIYLSGHGRRDANGEHFFVTNKGEISWKKLAKWLGKIKARTLVLLDACRAGNVQSQVANLIGKRDTGILVFAAARSWQNTYE